MSAEVRISDLVRAAEMVEDPERLRKALRVLQGSAFPDDLLSREELCERFGVSPKTVQRRCKPAAVLAGNNMYSLEQAESVLVRGVA